MIRRTLDRLSWAAWRAEYILAEAAALHLAAGRFWRAAGACAALALLVAWR